MNLILKIKDSRRTLRLREHFRFARTFSVYADIFGSRGHFQFARTFSVCADIFGLRGHFRFARKFSVCAHFFTTYYLFSRLYKKILTKLNCSPFPQAVAKCLSKFFQFSSKKKIIYLIQLKPGKKRLFKLEINCIQFQITWFDRNFSSKISVSYGGQFFFVKTCSNFF